MTTANSTPVYSSFPSERLTIGAGVAIFHVATARVVVCYHTGKHFWFLPKGRKNANEDVRHAAEREGFEESGYRNRLLPVPFKHRQTQPEDGPQPFATEAILMQFLPLSATVQYVLHWYVAETVPQEVEASYDGLEGRTYRPPAPFSEGMTLQQRIDLDSARAGDGQAQVYQPHWHEGTGVDEDEAQFRSHLLSIEVAESRLRGTGMDEVVKRGWKAIQLRLEMERKATGS